MSPAKPAKKVLKRSRHSLATIVYAFGARPPAQSDEAVIVEQLKLLKEYKRLRAKSIAECRAEIERSRRAWFSAYRTAAEALDDVNRKLEEAYDAIARERARVRKRLSIADIEEQIAELKRWRTNTGYPALKEARREVSAAHKDAYASLKERFQAVVNEHQAASNNTLKARLRSELESTMMAEDWPESWKEEMRSKSAKLTSEKATGRASGLWATTKDWARSDIRQAEAKTDAEGGRVAWPRELEGRIGATPNATVEQDGTVKSSAFSLDFAPDDKPGSSRRSQLRRKMIATFVFSKGVRIPIRVLVHRRLPACAKIARAWLQVRTVAGRLAYQVQMSVQIDSFGRASAKRHDEVVVTLRTERVKDAEPATWTDSHGAVRRVEETPIRLATWTGSDGSSGSIDLPGFTVESFGKSEMISSARTRHFNTAKRVTRLWMRFSWTVDQELTEATASNVKSPGRLCQAARRTADGVVTEDMWRKWKRFCSSEGEDLFPEGSIGLSAVRLCFKGFPAAHQMAIYLEWWRRKNDHLRVYEASVRQTAQRRRLDLYRRAAHALASRYESVSFITEKAPKTARKTKKDPLRAVAGNEKLNQRVDRIAARSILQGALKNAFR